MICISWAQATASNLLPFVFGAAALLAAASRPSRIVSYAPGASLSCRLAATPTT